MQRPLGVLRLVEGALLALVVQQPHHCRPEHRGVDVDVVLPVLEYNTVPVLYNTIQFKYNAIQYLEACGLEDADDIGSEPDAGLAVVPVGHPALGAEPA